MNETMISIGLINPKSPSNVGSVMRAAGCFQADEVFYTGHRYATAARFNTDTQNAASSISLHGVDCLLEQVDAETAIICIELVEGASSLCEFEHPDKVLYIFGPEDGTLKQELIDKADAVLYIPTRGCLNLAMTVNIVLYDRQTKTKALELSGDSLIRRSRDVNNSLRVK
jgi:tRNA(Leu) C34 or U34 (ribose-2'-O)-methylase TrmL